MKQVFMEQRERERQREENSFNEYAEDRDGMDRYDPLVFDLMTPKRIADDVLERGNMDALTAYGFLREMKAELEIAEARLKDAAIEELRKYGKGEHTVGKCRMQVKSSAGRWDYSEIPEWNKLAEERKRVEERAKAAFDAHANGEMLVSGDGEVRALPKYTPGAETIYVKIL